MYFDLCCAIQNVNDAVCRFRLSFFQLFSILSKRIVMLYLLTFTEVMKNDKSCVVFPPGIHITLRRIEITNALKTTGSFIIIFTNVFDSGMHAGKHSELLMHLHLYYTYVIYLALIFCKQNFTVLLSVFSTPLMTFCKELYIL